MSSFDCKEATFVSAIHLLRSVIILAGDATLNDERLVIFAVGGVYQKPHCN